VQGDLEPGNPIPLGPGEAEFVIGVGFRLTLHDMIWRSQERSDQGVLQHPLSRRRRTPGVAGDSEDGETPKLRHPDPQVAWPLRC
jgi:hypothetical protein